MTRTPSRFFRRSAGFSRPTLSEEEVVTHATTGVLSNDDTGHVASGSLPARCPCGSGRLPGEARACLFVREAGRGEAGRLHDLRPAPGVADLAGDDLGTPAADLPPDRLTYPTSARSTIPAAAAARGIRSRGSGSPPTAAPSPRSSTTSRNSRSTAAKSRMPWSFTPGSSSWRQGTSRGRSTSRWPRRC